jgi:glutathione S-transferase
LEGKWKTRLFIEKNTPLTEQIMPLLQAQSPEAKATQIAKTLELVRTFESYLVGPYAMGDQFTLADIAFISVFERLLTVGMSTLHTQSVISVLTYLFFIDPSEFFSKADITRASQFQTHLNIARPFHVSYFSLFVWASKCTLLYILQ